MLTISSVCAISVLRMVLFVKSNRKGSAADFTFTTTTIANWSMIEICASIACACLPTLKPLLVRLLPAFHSSSGDWHDDVTGYERPLTIGTAGRERRAVSRRDVEDGETGEGAGAEWSRGSFGSCSDGMSEKRGDTREEEFAGSAWSGHEEGREEMQSPAGSERPLRPSPAGTSADGAGQ